MTLKIVLSALSFKRLRDDAKECAILAPNEAFAITIEVALMDNYYVYILTNKSNKVLYVGITNNIHRRMHEHSQGKIDSFTARYNVTKLVYLEHFNHPVSAIIREKKLKKFSRAKKEALINEKNPSWEDLMKKINRNV
jgi:putative endonuclease